MHVAPCNAHLVPKLRFDDYPTNNGDYTDSLIASRYAQYAFDGAPISQVRTDLWTYPNREQKLAAFDRWLMNLLHNCADRPAPLVP